MFLLEVRTWQGPISELFETYEEAARRLDSLPLDQIVSTPFIYQKLPDGSERVVREDQKPLQAHRIPEEVIEDEPITLADSPLEHGEIPTTPIIRAIPRWKDEDEEEPLPLLEGPFDDPTVDGKVSADDTAESDS